MPAPNSKQPIVSDDLVTITDIARELKLAPNAIHMTIARGVAGFPAPAIQGRTRRLWSLQEVLNWWKEYRNDK